MCRVLCVVSCCMYIDNYAMSYVLCVVYYVAYSIHCVVYVGHCVLCTACCVLCIVSGVLLRDYDRLCI